MATNKFNGSLLLNELKDLFMIMSIVLLFVCAFYNLTAGIYISMSIALLAFVFSVLSHIICLAKMYGNRDDDIEFSIKHWVHLIFAVIFLIIGIVLYFISLKDITFFGYSVNFAITLALAVFTEYFLEKVVFVVYSIGEIIFDFIEYLKAK